MRPRRSSLSPGRQVALLEGHPEEVYHCEFMQVDGDASGSIGGGRLLLLVASSESLFVWDVRSKALIQKADAPGTLCSSLKPEGRARSGPWLSRQSIHFAH